MEEGLIYSPDHPIKLPVFEGPLDLLLFLIRKNEVDIYDIPIKTVTDQYLRILRDMETLNLEVAGDFFVMAATLMYIKSRMLLPQKERIAEVEEDSEEEIDPRWELVQQLLEYRRIKETSESLQELIEQANDLLPRAPGNSLKSSEPRPLKKSDRIELWNTFNQVLRRLTERMVVGEIHDEVVTISDRMEFILNKARSERRFTFSSLFDDSPGVSMIVATFLALLELARTKDLDLEQEKNFSEIICTRVADIPS